MESGYDVPPRVAVALARRHPAEVRALHPLIDIHLVKADGGAMARARARLALRLGLELKLGPGSEGRARIRA